MFKRIKQRKRIKKTLTAIMAVLILFTINNIHHMNEIKTYQNMLIAIALTVFLAVITYAIHDKQQKNKNERIYNTNKQFIIREGLYTEPETDNTDEYDCMDREMTNDEKQAFIKKLQQYAK